MLEILHLFTLVRNDRVNTVKEWASREKSSYEPLEKPIRLQRV